MQIANETKYRRISASLARVSATKVNKLQIGRAHSILQYIF